MGPRDPTGALDVSDLLRRDTEPLFRVVADVAVIGSPEAVEATQRILAVASDLVFTSTRRGEEGARDARSVRGDRWTAEQGADSFGA